ncbi:MAG: putative helix-destabilizing protein [Prokaryotic dsDNA virus sp.]|jgi:hypothetical protein|nr:MAG: putative helix-destabilizing protein [Prokaryotic dsDNA virus sp.]|tara:strand:+ start:18876 stop:19547 length:672 start_codon:yes stop_codon:yes gene_type:complete
MAKQTITTPTGIALYPWLSKPDTEYNKDGEYKVNLVLSKKEAQPIIDTINEVFSENLKDELKKQKKKTIKTANPPYADELDDDGKPTGNVIFKFKSKAAYKPAIFDAGGDTLTDTQIWGGSEIRVNAALYPYFVSTIGAGVSLKLRAVQVIALVEGSEGAGRFGFEKTSGYIKKEKEEGSEVFDNSPSVVEEKVAEPEVVKSKPENDGSTDIADIVDKWGAKD